MNYKQAFFLYTPDNLQLQGYHWQPKEMPKAIVLFVHGIAEHMGRFDDFATFFCKNQIACIGINFRGIAGSSGKHGDNPSYETYFNDLDLLFHKIKTEHPDLPVFVYAYSHGANIYFNYALRKEAFPVKGIIYASLIVKQPEKFSKVQYLVAKAASKIVPSFVFDYEFDPSFLSKSSMTVHSFLNDPMKVKKMSIRVAYAYFKHLKILQKYEGELKFNSLFMHGSDDLIATITGTEELLERIQGDNFEYKKWEGLFHELHSEPEKEEVRKYILNWIQKRIAENPSGWFDSFIAPILD